MNIKALAAIATLGLATAGCVETTTTTTTLVSDGLNRNVLIVNRSGQTVFRFYGSNSSRPTWEEDILGSQVLPNGRSIMIDFWDGTTACMFDFKVEFVDGRSIEDYGINVCAVSTYTIR